MPGLFVVRPEGPEIEAKHQKQLEFLGRHNSPPTIGDLGLGRHKNQSEQ